MFCPRCGSTQSDDLRFCKVCGANLHAVKQAVDTREPEEHTVGSKNWVQQMFLLQEEKKQREMLGIKPEVNRYNEIKAGVIVSNIGIAIAIFLYFFMQGLISSGKVAPDSAEILSHLWVAGVIPLFVGFALMINGMVVSKKLVEAARRYSQSGSASLEGEANPSALGPASTNELISTPFSVTEQTTRHLSEVERKSDRKTV